MGTCQTDNTKVLQSGRGWHLLQQSRLYLAGIGQFRFCEKLSTILMTEPDEKSPVHYLELPIGLVVVEDDRRNAHLDLQGGHGLERLRDVPGIDLASGVMRVNAW